MPVIIPFLPDERSIYFKTLQHEQDPAYQLFAQWGQKYLQLPNWINPKEQEGLTRFNGALKILELGIQRERAAEEIYFRNFLQQMQSTLKGSKLLNQFQQIFNNNNGSFDYPKLINFMNELYDGLENYKKMREYEQQRLEQLHNIFAGSNIRDTLKKRLASKWKTNQSSSKIDQAIDRIIERTYLDYHRYDGVKLFKDIFSEVNDTIDTVMAQAVNKAMEELLSDTQFKQQLIQTYIASGLTLNGLKVLLCNYLIMQLSQQASVFIKSINDKVEPVIIRLITKNIDTTIQQHKLLPSTFISGQSEFFGKRSTVFNIDQQGDLEVTAEGLAEKLERFVKDLDQKSKNQSITEAEYALYDVLRFTPIAGYNNLLEAIRESIRLGEQLTSNPELKNSRTQLRSTITRIAGGNRGKTTNIAGHLNAISNLITTMTPDEFKQQVSRLITPKDFSISGPELSEIIEAIQGYLLQQGSGLTATGYNFPGFNNNKADMFSISIRPDTTQIAQKLTDVYANGINHSLRDQETQIKSQLIKIYKAELSLTQKEIENLANIQARSFDLNQGYFAFWKGVEEIQSTLQEEEKRLRNSGEDEEKIRQTLNELKESLVLTTSTMKTFKTYNENIGFLSGSLGANTALQVQNFASLFQAAGVPMSYDEQTWLEVALVNCSPAALGYSNKDPIETYLSTLIGFAMFDEGTAEVELIAGNATHELAQTNPRIMHIYRLNGLYFPGSYILQRVYDRLSATLNDTNQILKDPNNHDGAKIKAAATPSLIPKGDFSNEDKWKQTYEIASSKAYTSVSFAFLSDLLNIIKQLNAADGII